MCWCVCVDVYVLVCVGGLECELGSEKSKKIRLVRPI